MSERKSSLKVNSKRLNFALVKHFAPRCIISGKPCNTMHNYAKKTFEMLEICISGAIIRRLRTLLKLIKNLLIKYFPNNFHYTFLLTISVRSLDWSHYEAMFEFIMFSLKIILLISFVEPQMYWTSCQVVVGREDINTYTQIHTYAYNFSLSYSLSHSFSFSLSIYLSIPSIYMASW